MVLGSKQGCPAPRKALFGLVLRCSYLEVLNDFLFFLKKEPRGSHRNKKCDYFILFF